ncbi:hypothetical protein JGB26_26725 [Streptomyces flavofungini]|uniref:Transcriptional regulator n=1 Tax=Streptomyces flavofungini TaxID=68200 RepID=A0ABS0XBR4_9ACTN|nr:hypothetical protein [Streptomyces flavofungini]MBJ3810652.1 hypothetical protein [Streptomyces flavofungini]
MSIGLSQSEYAKLIAEAHVRLGGVGHMAARREKVARWESGQIVPEIPAQIAMAHFHQVPEEAVMQLGWPLWLHLATGDVILASRPWTFEGAVDALRATEHLAGSWDRSYLAVTDPAVGPLAEQWRLAMAAHLPSPTPKGALVTPDTVKWATVLNTSLGKMVGTVSPSLLCPAAHGDLVMLSGFLSQECHDRKSRGELLRLAAMTAGLCGGLNISLGETARAERYFLTAARCATAAGDAQLAVAQMAGVAYCHLLVGAHRNVLPLLDAAEANLQRPGGTTAAILHLLTARAHACGGEANMSARALERAHTVLATHSPSEAAADCGLARNIDENWAVGCEGIVWFHLGRPKLALERFTPLLKRPGLPRFFPLAAQEVFSVVDTQLALGDVEAAAHSARRAAANYGRPPSKVTRQFRDRFAAHRTVPAVRDLVDFLAEPTVS